MKSFRLHNAIIFGFLLGFISFAAEANNESRNSQEKEVSGLIDAQEHSSNGDAHLSVEEKEVIKQQKIREFKARKERERAEKIAAAQKREEELRKQAKKEAEIKKSQPAVPQISEKYDNVIKNGSLTNEIKRIVASAPSGSCISIGGFRLGMDIQDAWILAKTYFPDIQMEPRLDKDKLQILIGNPKTLDRPDNLEGAFAQGIFGNDISYVLAEANRGDRCIYSLRMPSPMTLSLLKIQANVSHDQFARSLFRKLNLDWEYDYEYGVYTYRSADNSQSLQAFTKETKLSYSWTVMSPGDIWLHQ